MMNDMLKNKKNLYIVLAICITALFLAVYIYALTRPGVWHGKTFLYLQADESYVGNGAYFDYRMTIAEQDNGAAISFFVDEEARNYIVQTDEGERDVTIYEDGVLLFDGFYNSGFLMNDDGLDFEITVTSSNSVAMEPVKEDYFPTNTQLYKWATMDKPDMRGDFTFVLYLAFAIAYLIIDFCFPDFFFHLEHFLTVDGGTPSEFYRIGQWVGRIAMIILSVVCVFISLNAT